MRDYLMMLLIGAGFLLALRSTFAAYVFWGWSSIYGPGDQVWGGVMRDLQYSQWFALLTLFGLLVRRHKREPGQAGIDGVGIVAVLFAVQVLIAASASYPEVHRNWEIATNVLKILLYVLLAPLVLVSRERVLVFVLAITLAMATLGAAEGLKFLITAGGHTVRGSPRLGDNNHYGLFMVMTVPLLIYLFNQFRNRLARWAAGGTTVLMVLTVVATNSRGALLALVGMALWLVLRSRRKVQGLALVVAASVVVIALAPESWFERMDTINNAQEDGSFMGRVMSWKRASAIAMEHPLTGGGFHSVQEPSVFLKYRDRQGFLGFIDTPIPDYPLAAHSIYFEVLGDGGFPALALFLLLMFSPFVMAARTRRLAKARGESAQWAADLATMLTVAMTAYLVGGAAVSMAYVDMPYALVAVAGVLPRLLRVEAAVAVRSGPSPGAARAAAGA